MKKSILILIVNLTVFGAAAVSAMAQGTTAFTYSGRLLDGVAPANGIYDLQFTLHHTEADPNTQVGDTKMVTTNVVNGLFILDLDFGATAFNGQRRWLELSIKRAVAASWTTISPRRQITSAPYALYSGKATTLDGDGAGLTELNADYLANGTVPDMRLPNNIARLDANQEQTFLGPITMRQLLNLRGDGLAVGQNILVVTNFNVGIGTSDPKAALDVHHGDVHIDGDGNNHRGLYFEGGINDPHYYLKPYATAGAAGMRLEGWDGVRLRTHSGDILNVSDDKVGIGTTMPKAQLSLGSSTADTKLALWDDGTGNASGLYGLGIQAGQFRFHVNDDPTARFSFLDSPNGQEQELMAIDGPGSSGGRIRLFTQNNIASITLEAQETSSTGGQIILRNAADKRTVQIDGDALDNGSGYIALHKSDGSVGIVLATDSSGHSKVTTQVLQITGGGDLSENFDITAPDRRPEPGMVVCIDPANPGKLVLSNKAHDRTVAGIISGANGIETGMRMGQVGSIADGKHPVALTGRVYAWADAARGPIQPGDLLTTSDTPGHAMKVTDHARAQGAIIGKAMSALHESKGLVLVLVTLQ